MRKQVSDDSKIKRVEGLSEREEMLLYMDGFMKIVPESKLEEPSPSDSPEVQQRKVLDGIRFQKGVHDVEVMYGENTVEKIFTVMAAEPEDNDKYADDAEVIAKVKEFKELMMSRDLIDESTLRAHRKRVMNKDEVKEEVARSKTASESTATAPTPDQPTPTATATETSADSKAAPPAVDTDLANAEDGAEWQAPLLAAGVVAGVIAVGAALWFRSRKTE